MTTVPNRSMYANERIPAYVPVGLNHNGDFIPFAAGGVPGLDIPAHDYIALAYTGSDLTGVVYKTGGANGTTVATLTLTYSGGNLVSVAKS